MKNICLIIAILLGTLAISQKINAQGLEVYNQNNAYPGYTLFPYNNNAYLIDNCGKIVNQWNTTSSSRLATYLMPNGNLFWMGQLSTNNTFIAGGGGGGLLEIYNPAGSLIWSYQFHASNQFAAHHDCEVLPNGNILIVAWEQLSNIEAFALGRNTNSLPANKLWATAIFEISPVGTNQINTVWEWHLKDHVVQDINSNLSNFGIIADNPQLLDINKGPSGADWLHVNGIDYNEQLDQIIFSSAFLDELFIIDHSTTTAEAATSVGGIYGKGGDILYRWGNPQNYERGNNNDKILDLQHDCRWIRKGFVNQDKISVFNNRGFSQTQSAIEIFTPPMDSLGFYTQPINNTTPFGPFVSDNTFTNGPDGSFSSNNQGGAQVLPNGNIMVSASTQNYLFELDVTTNTVVWQYLIPFNVVPFKAVRYLANDIELDNYTLTPGTTIEFPSSTLTNNCATINYPFFCVFNYFGNDALQGQEFSAKADYETDGIIESTQSIEPFAEVDYDSNTEIILLPGFEVKINADFYAIIDGCNNGLGGLN